MAITKKITDQLIKLLFGGKSVPKGLFELSQYFRLYGPISFTHQTQNGLTIATSTNFRYGSIITSGKNNDELDKNIKDAILTSFEVPSSYAQEVKLHKTGERKGEYALA